MHDIAVALSVAAIAGVVVLFFAWAWLLRTVRDLQRTLIQLGNVRRSNTDVQAVPEFANGNGPTLVLVVDTQCMACIERAAAFDALAGRDPQAEHSLVLLSGSEKVREWGLGHKVKVVVNSELVGSLAVRVTPTLIHFDRDGVEKGRRVAGDDRDLERAILMNSVIAG